MALVEDGGAVLVVADMTKTNFCDSAGITALATAHKKLSSVGADLKVIAAAPQVLRILELTGLDRVLDVYPTKDAALAS